MNDASNKYLMFYVDEDIFSLSFDDVVQIIPAQTPQSIPDFPDYVLGTVMYEGERYTIISLRKRFGCTTKSSSGRECIMICGGAKKIGLLCDSIVDFKEVDEDSIYPPPDVNEHINARFISGSFVFNDKVDKDMQCFIISPELVIRAEDDDKFPAKEE